MIRDNFDFAVIGAGFAGSLTALLLQRLGNKVVLIERGSHPRFALGESSTPMANLILEELAREYDLPWLAPLARYGPWKRTYPDLVCGKKRGFTFVRHHPERTFVPEPDHSDHLLVTASPDDEHADTHWLRSDIDAFLAEQAVQAGVRYLDHTQVRICRDLRGWGLAGQRKEEQVRLKTRFVVDASGMQGQLARDLDIATTPENLRTHSWSIFSHFADVTRWEEILTDLGGKPAEHPYPCDEAALHHVLDEGWMWLLRFDNGITSAGFLFDGTRRRPDLKLSADQEWQATLERYPAIARQFKRSRPVRAIERTGRLQRLARRVAGDGWAMLAPAAYSLDALYSTGNAHALLSVQRLVRLLGRNDPADQRQELQKYQETLLREVAFLDRLVWGTYRAFRNFDLLTSYAMYYFAGAISAEERKNQGITGKAEEFLSSHIPEFRALVEHGADTVAELSDQAHPDVGEFQRRVARDIAPWNTVGLCDPGKRNLYPYA